MPDVITMGEALIDFIPVQAGRALADVTDFRRAAGGAPFNVAVGLARLGVDVGLQNWRQPLSMSGGRYWPLPTGSAA